MDGDPIGQWLIARFESSRCAALRSPRPLPPTWPDFLSTRLCNSHNDHDNMSVLHTYFHRRDQQAFQHAVDTAVRSLSHSTAAQSSSSLGRSFSSSPSALVSSSAAALDINARDALGRTVLHLACSSTHPSAPTYVRLVLAHPHAHLNLPDAESHWTPLHRALYAGNLAAALLLLQRPDLDVHAKDWEGYTPYDLWNSSVEGTNPDPPPRRHECPPDELDAVEAELYVWGSNRNAGLGVGDAGDRTFPELVQFDRDKDGQGRSAAKTIGDRFRPVKVRAVDMARFHTAIVTSEQRANLRVCGFGSGARLGSGLHTTTYTPTSLAGLPSSPPAISPGYPPPSRAPSSSAAPQNASPRATASPPPDPQRIVAVAAGQDHTLVLTAAGEVWSWGSNRNAVLGYVVEPASAATPAADEPHEDKGGAPAAAWQEKWQEKGEVLQPGPRKVQGQLKGRRVRAVSACRTASACVTLEGEVLTWGVNSGQLGYDRAAHPVQTLPRLVTKVSQPVLDVTITDCATALLLHTHDVLLLTAQHGAHRLAFPSLAFPRTATAAYRPPQAARPAAVARVVATELAPSSSAHAREGALFAALSRAGELFTWAVAAPEAVTSTSASASAVASGAGGANAREKEKERERERERREVVRPQRVWALRRKFSAVRDVALGADGSAVVCTASGHVFVRSRLPAAAGASISASAAGAGTAAVTTAASSAFSSASAGTEEFAGKAATQAQAQAAGKFQRVPGLQRVVRVYASSAGAFGALRVDARAEDVVVAGRTLRADVERVAPWFGAAAAAAAAAAEAEAEEALGGEESGAREKVLGDGAGSVEEDGDDVHDPAVVRDQRELVALLGLLDRHAQAIKAAKTVLPPGGAPATGDDDDDDANALLVSPLDGESPRVHGADLLVHVLGGTEPRIPAHRAILAARSPVLRETLRGKQAVEARVPGGPTIRIALAKDKDRPTPSSSPPPAVCHPSPWSTPARLTVSGAHPLTVLLLLRYLYADALVAVWDWRVAAGANVGWLPLLRRPAQIKAELQALAAALALPEMARALEGAFKRDVRPTLARDLQAAEAEVCEGAVRAAGATAAGADARDPLRPDVVLVLADREVGAHAVVLRARSPFFRAFFDEPAWTARRWTAAGTVRVDLRHMRWREVRHVVRYLYGADAELFDALVEESGDRDRDEDEGGAVASADELVEAVFGVMAAANELLLDRLVLLCSRVIQQRIAIPNATSILADATFFNATALVQSVQGYLARNLETFLEHHMLDDLPADLIKQFAQFVRAEQTRKAPVARSGRLAADAMRRHRAWADMQDWPSPVVRSTQPRPPPVRKREAASSSPPPPPVRPVEKRKSAAAATSAADDELFVMDSVEAIPPLSLSSPVPPNLTTEPKAGGWKVPGAAPRTDMKAIMAEAAASTTPRPGPSTPRTPAAASDVNNWRVPQRKPSSAALTDGNAPRSSPSGGSPWKPVLPVTSAMASLAVGSSSPVLTPPMTPQMRATRGRDEAPLAKQPTTAAAQQQQRPGMGPVFSPSKQAAQQKGTASPMRRTASGNAAWTLPPVQPTVQPSSSLAAVATPSPSGMSFVAIQELQREQGGRGKEKARSLKEIQEEEQARRVEEEFLTWWAAEEERLRAEQAGESSPGEAGPRRAKGKRREGAKDGAKTAAGEGARERKETRREGGAKDVGGPTESSAPGTPRRRRRPGPGPSAKPEGARAKSDLVRHQQQQ
ncbi:uncharacterized protein PHACADRAFT_213674 [Phanerochaete carnosa HHB-10118-sp]|uniref:BTB domain-containing protein n=1 Tax=Phanerochaete carnosa (strain HHB-10118-sp) TaxID=650164 RepID=K5VW58_PHACS|nr:uncharacterized protein PHACADRAFT_213674 [Phanerochaete carnosa HHB-10118-sp]EKM50804.1 hypothetical protein PHACADRAFT_213674 [Phanerochaete carnosa HHB-10118-sp]